MLTKKAQDTKNITSKVTWISVVSHYHNTKYAFKNATTQPWDIVLAILIHYQDFKYDHADHVV